MANKRASADHKLSTAPRAPKTPYRRGGYWLSKRRDGRSDVWMVSWYDPVGRQVRYRSTRARDLGTAKAFLDTHANENPSPPARLSVAPRQSVSVYFIGGDVEIDETFIGGRIARKQHGGSPVEGKTVVFGMLERGGDVMTHVVADRKRSTIFPLVTAAVRPASTVHTDEYSTYRNIASLGYAHTTVNHAAREYATACGKGVNSIEGFWSQLKRSINGTHIHVSPKHLSKYLGEHEYRWNMRRQPHLMLDRLLVSFVR